MKLEEIKKRYKRSFEKWVDENGEENLTISNQDDKNYILDNTDWLIRRVEKLEDALKFYADQRNYLVTKNAKEIKDKVILTPFESVFAELGTKAREALKDDE